MSGRDLSALQATAVWARADEPALAFLAAVPRFSQPGRCAEIGGDMFYPEIQGEAGAKQEAEAAKRICRICPVVDECLQYALDHDERHGVWGATSPKERRKLRQQLGMPSLPAVRADAAECGTRSGYQRHRRRGEAACQSCLAAERRRHGRGERGAA